MKKLIASLICTTLIAAAGTTFTAAKVLAADAVTLATSSTSASAPAESQVVSIAMPNDQNKLVPVQVGITPDSPLYFVKTLIENIKVSLTFSADNKAELLVSLAGERLAEANLMTERNKEKLVEKVMKAYIKTVNAANEQIKEAAGDGKDVKGVLDDIRIVELTADKLVIKATGIVPKESAAELQTRVTDTVRETLAVQAFANAKAEFFKARDAVNKDREELKAAIKAGDAAKIKAAQDKLNQDQQYKEQMEKAKDTMEAYKDQIKKEVGDKEKVKEDKDEDKDDDREIKIEKAKEKAEQKAEKLKEQLEKQAEHQEKMEEKAKEKFEKAKGRIERKEEESRLKAVRKQVKNEGKSKTDRDDEDEDD